MPRYSNKWIADIWYINTVDIIASRYLICSTCLLQKLWWCLTGQKNRSGNWRLYTWWLHTYHNINQKKRFKNPKN